jgi:hypothetical protein
MGTELIVGVAAGLIVAAILGLLAWLRKPDNRAVLRHALCAHDWFDPNVELNEPGSPLVFISPVNEECRKCGKAR